MKMCLFGSVLSLFLGLAAGSPAVASVNFGGTDGSGREATAVFSASGSTLTIVLSNTALSGPAIGDATKQNQMLSAIFFDLATNAPLTLQSAAASGPLGIYQQNSTANTNANGSLQFPVVANLAAPGSTNGGPGAFQGGWQYREQFADFSGLTQNRGIGTNGLGIFNGNQVKTVDNLDYALTSVEDNVATSQAKQLFNFPLIKNTITFTFNGLPNGFLLNTATIGNVRFQYGTSLTEPSITDVPGEGDEPPDDGGGGGVGQVPEPATIAVWSVLGLCAAAGSMLRRWS